MRKCLIVLLIGLLSLFMVDKVQAVNTRPVISGNYQQGERIYTEEEGTGDNYLFREGWFKYKQNLSTAHYYYLKVSFAENDYRSRDQYDSLTYDLLGNYTYQLMKPLRLKTEINLRNKRYPLAETKNYQAVGTDLEVSYKFYANQLICSFNAQQEFHQSNDRDNLLTGISVRLNRKMWTGFKVHGIYKLSGTVYYSPNGLQDRVKQSISIGFEYQI